MADNLPNAQAIAAMRDIYACLLAATTRDVTDELGLRNFSVTDLRVTVSRHILSTEIEVYYRSPDRDTGGIKRFSSRMRVRSLAPLTAEERADHVRWAVMWAILHELDEMITVNGARIFDPHRPVKRRWLPRISLTTWLTFAVGWSLASTAWKLLGWTAHSWWEVACPIFLVLGVALLVGIVRQWGQWLRIIFCDRPMPVRGPTVVMARAGAVGVDGDGRPIDG